MFTTHTLILTLSISPSLSLSPRQAETSPPPPDPFPAAASQLLSLYIPPSIQSLLYSYYTSLSPSATGDPASIIENAFTAVTPPAWLDALPTEYRSNIHALESAIASLRVAATGGVGASVTPPALTVLTTLDEAGSGSGSGVETTSALSSSSLMTGSSETETETVSSTPRGGLVPQRPTPSFIWGSTESPGLAVATNRPVVAAAGVLGFVGAVLVM